MKESKQQLITPRGGGTPGGPTPGGHTPG